MLDAGHPAALMFVGGTGARCHEIDEELAAQLRRKVSGLDEATRRHVRFIDATPHIDAYYRAADIFALPSMSEGLPNALLEAMACGLPCVASHLPGITDTVIEHGVNGLLHAPINADALATLLQRLVQHPAWGAQLGRAARATIEQRFAIAQVAAQYRALYRRLLGLPPEFLVHAIDSSNRVAPALQAAS
jgi:glycosyltransferase involved in cell wall biosynthesis